jgi:1-acyl-sn-glycerol-3-phosphate acyltransferase
MAMINTFELMPSGEKPKLGIRPGVRFGEPLDFSKYYGMEEDRAVLRTITDEIMRALQKLSGQEYVDRYAADVKAELQGAAQPQDDPLDALDDPAPPEPKPTADDPERRDPSVPARDKPS